MLVVKQFFWGLLGIASVVMLSSLLTVYLTDNDRSTALNATRDIFADRNFNEAPFNAQDAGLACTQESNQRFGATLVRSRVDWRSTRFDEGRELWLVVLNGDVGDLYQYDEATIYCYINPKTYVVSYFKAYDSESQPLLERVGFSCADLVAVFK